jgi:PAT family beta-lactamase induction signal transducer AmpG
MVAAHASYSGLKQVFVSRRMAAMLGLGFASGLPLALSSGTLQAWLTLAGVDLSTLGFFALAGLPYTFKFVWAPLVDRFEPPGLGRRRGWLCLTQVLLAVLCWAMAACDPRTSLGALGVLAVALAFVSASHDIAFDAYRADLLPASERGAGAAVSVLGYRVAMLVSGGLALVLADQWLGWPQTYRLMGGLFALAALATLLAPPVVELAVREHSDARGEWRGFLAMIAAAGLTGWLAQTVFHAVLPGADRFVKLGTDTAAVCLACAAALWAARRAGFPSFIAPWDAFFSRPQAGALLALIVLYKLGDALGGALSTAFLIRGVGLSATEVGTLNKGLGLLATVVGALAGGAWLARRSLWQSLMLFGVLQAVSNLGYWWLAVVPKSFVAVALAIGLEHLCGGLGTAAFVAFLMSLTEARYTAAQYALLSALAVLGRVYVGPVSGLLVESMGWSGFFLVSVGAALPGLVLLAFMRPVIDGLMHARQGSEDTNGV